MNEKINVCHFADHLQGEIDGVFNHIKMILQYGDTKKYKHFLFFQGDKFIENEFRKLDGEIVIIKSIEKKISLKAFWDFYKKVRSNRIQIIHAHFLKPYAVAGLMNIFLRRKLIYNYHGLFIDNEFYNKLEKLIYKTAHFIINFFGSVHLAICPSYKSKEILLQETKLFPGIESYYNGPLISESVTDDSIIKKFVNNDKFKIVFIGRLVDQKKIDIALKIISECKNLNLFFYIIGDGILRSFYEELATKLKIHDKVFFLGYIPFAGSYLKYFDLLLITSEYEGFPFVLWEAMAASTPVLASDVGGIAEIVVKENCGLVFNYNDPADAVDKLNTLYKNNDLRKSLGSNGYKAVKEKYNPYSFGKTIDNFYNKLLSNETIN